MGKALDKLSKLESRLRCVANGDTEVNIIRAERNGAVEASQSLLKPRRPTARTASVSEPSIKTNKTEVRKLERGKQTKLSDDIKVNVFVLFEREDTKSGRLIRQRRGRVGTASVTIADLAELSSSKEIQSIELGETLKAPQPFVGSVQSKAPERPLLAELNARNFEIKRNGKTAKSAIGENVLMGIIDVGGIDFAHPDFLDAKGNPRIVRIWDQGGTAFASPDARDKKKRGFDYGSEITAQDMRDALREAKQLHVAPHDLAPQSQRIPGSHATHVASIAAGNSGVCQRAKIAAVLISLPIADLDRRASFYDTTRIVDAIEYLLGLADEMPGIDAVSINISLGTNGGGHDGSEMVSRWIDSAMATPGRSICVAAGNSGQEAPEYGGDLGFLSGRIHASGRISSAALRRDLDWMVIGDGVEDISENELEIWYNAQDEFDVSLRTPAGHWIGPIGPSEQVENLMLPDRTFVSIYNELSCPKNGDNKISLFLSPFMNKVVVGVTPGRWTVRLTGRVVRDGRFDAWIERDDPGPVGPGGDRRLWHLPSFFGEQSFVDNSSVSSLACGPYVTGVANLDEARERMNASSSQGPTRDGRFKPDIAAPGTEIRAARGFDPGALWVEMTGTSMASPYVAGVAGLMLSLCPALTAAQIAGVIQRTASPLPGVSYEWRNDAGFGAISPLRCLEEVDRLMKARVDRTQEYAEKKGVGR